MPGKILILGAAGRLGRAAAIAFRDAGWTVVSFVKPGGSPRAVDGTTVIEDDALDEQSVVEAAAGADVILHAINTPFSEWPKKAVRQAEIAIAAAKASGATLMFPGNLYVYGHDLPPQIDETTPMRPDSRKGKLRVAIEQRLARAAEEGVRVIILRAGDFYGGTAYGSWFDLVIARDIDIGVVRYPGPLLTPHAWAYLPDVAATLVRLADRRASLKPFDVFAFPGHPATGGQLLVAVRDAARRAIKRRRFPWWTLRLLSPFVGQWREVIEVSHLWKKPHRIEGEKLKAAIGDIPETPFPQAVAAALADLGLGQFQHPATR